MAKRGVNSVLLDTVLALNLIYFIAAGVKRSVVALKLLPIPHHSADYIISSPLELFTVTFSLPEQSPGRAIALPPALVLAEC